MPAATLEHPNIVRAFDADEDGSRLTPVRQSVGRPSGLASRWGDPPQNLLHEHREALVKFLKK